MRSHFAAIQRRLEAHPLLGDFAQLRETENLEATGVGENRPLPVHEAVQTAVRLDDLRAPAAACRWKVLPSTICAPSPASSSGVMDLTVP